MNTGKVLRVVVPVLLVVAAGPVAAQGGSEPELQFGDTLVTVTGFDGPEAVRYDADQDVYFVSNFNGEASGDANGFVSKVSADGAMLEREFMVGTDDLPFHGGRGMYIVGDTLWVADAGGIHEFDRHSGAQLGFVDFSAFDPGFINDIVMADDGNLYVTDTGRSRIYKVSGRVVTVATETPFGANGITVNPENGRLIIVPWNGSKDFIQWDIDSGKFDLLGSASTGGNYDGVEVIRGAIISASQEDESLHMMTEGKDRLAIRLPGRPADIGVDTRRQRVAVPYVSLDQVDIIATENR